MNKQVCTPGKLLKNYIIDYLILGIFIAALVAILQIVCSSLVETFGLGSLLLIGITALLNIIGNFFVIYLTIRTLFKKYTILGVDVKSFLNKTIIFYVILLILFIVYNLLGYTSFIVETINLVLNVLILAFQFFYTRYMTMKEVSNNNFNYQINNNMNMEQNNQMHNQYFNNMSNQVQDNQVENQYQVNMQFNQNDLSGSYGNYMNQNVYQNSNINQFSQEIVNQNNIVNNDTVNNGFIQDINLSNNIINQNSVNTSSIGNNHGISINSIDNNKAINSIHNLESGNIDSNQVKTKICPECRKEISINNNFCNICGYVYRK